MFGNVVVKTVGQLITWKEIRELEDVKNVKHLLTIFYRKSLIYRVIKEIRPTINLKLQAITALPPHHRIEDELLEF